MPSWNDTDFIANDVLLDFLNTVGDHNKDRSEEKLASWEDVLSWANYGGLITNEEAQCLDLLAGQENSLTRLREFREASFDLISSVAGGTEAPVDCIQVVEKSVHLALSVSRFSKDELVWKINLPEAGSELVGHRLALHLFKLLGSPDLLKIRECNRCSWLFIDRGRGSGRVWCRMAGCGNRAKAERFRATQ